MPNVYETGYYEAWIGELIWLALMCEMEYLDYRALADVEGRG